MDEQIKLFGSDIYYLPKTVLADSTLDEVRYTKYQDQFQIEMLLVNVMGFGDNAEFISKFGLTYYRRDNFSCVYKKMG